MTAFGQLLVHNVMHYASLLDGLYPGLTVVLRPNSRKTAYHVLTRAPGMVWTISAVPDRLSKPRFAFFRDEYATRQAFFMVNENNDFEMRLPVNFFVGSRYFHILHGPRPDNRRELGFILMAEVDSFGEYVAVPQDLDDFVSSIFNVAKTSVQSPPVGAEVIKPAPIQTLS